MPTTVERIAGWAAELALDDVPGSVLDLSRAQRRSVLAALAASTHDAAAQRVLAGVETWAADGPIVVPGLGRAVRTDDAIYAASVLSIALDYDDYSCFAHTGHSAVLVPLLMAAETNSSGADQLVAQVVAHEVEARLGGACLLGPLNGQLWSFVHAAGSALAAGRLLGLDAGRMAHALALALYQAPRPTIPGFMAPDSKLITAAEPTLVGVRAARLAAGGVTGPLDALDHPHGFLDAFAYVALPAVLGGLGTGWATRTLSIKRYPGCAYVDTTVDALLELGPPPADEVASITVDASVLSCEMDSLSSSYGVDGPPTPVTVNFSIPWNVATTVLAGRLTPAETSEQWLHEQHAALAALASRVTLRHDWELTLRTAEAMAPLLPPRAMFAGTKGGSVVGGIRRVRRDHNALRVRPADAMALVRAARGANSAAARKAMTDREMWTDDALEGFAMTFPARVSIRLRSGQELVTEVDVPHGGAGSSATSPEVVSREKLALCGPAVWGADGCDAIAKAVDTDDAGLWRLLGSTP